jgi:uncharacterized protein
MTVEVSPVGVNCNLRCTYCYQNAERDAGNLHRRYDLQKIKLAIESTGQPFTLFGGEILMMPMRDLESLLAWGFQRNGNNVLQTNGTLINDEHVDLFKRYRVHVGISIDGPGALNDLRSAGTLEKTRAATKRTEAAIDRLLNEGVSVALIVTLHGLNAAPDKLPALRDWFRHLDRRGARQARLHTLQVQGAAEDRRPLTIDERIEAFLSLSSLEKELTTLRFDVFQEIRALLTGQDERVSCVWNACDPYDTQAVYGISGDGAVRNCARLHQDGVDFLKAASRGSERYLALYHTPRAHGGCQGCRFFLMCKGYCPGTAIDGDWRNRSSDCQVIERLFQHVEAYLAEDGVTPLSRHPERERLERAFVEAWAKGTTLTISRALKELQP